MLMSEMQFPAGTPLQGYGPGVFTLGGRVHRGGLMILPTGIHTWAPGLPPVPGDFEALIAAAPEIDVVLVGLGAEIGVLPRETRAALEAAGLGMDVMATPPACRTYNVLLAENRRVAAALLPV